MNLEDKVKKYATLERFRCKECGNKWWFSLETQWECTTCNHKIDKTQGEQIAYKPVGSK